jgi:hypothetical protein
VGIHLGRLPGSARGERKFRKLATAYLSCYPSDCYTLRNLWKPARTVSPGRATLERAAGGTGARHGAFRVGAGRRIRRAIEAADQSRRYPGYSAVEVAARLAAVSFAA